MIVLINHSDVRGGASVVTYRLMRALCNMGYDARMLVTHKGTDDPRVDVLEPAWRRRAAFLAECAQIYAANGHRRAEVFKVSTAAFGMDVMSHPWMRAADAVILGWINQGTLALGEIERIAASGRTVVWTMHDMWNATGICHHSGTCNRFQAQCGCCPMLNSQNPADLSAKVFNKKHSLYAGNKIHFVAVSNWLAQRCHESALMRDAQVSVIPNAFPLSDFSTSPALSRAALGLPDGPLVVMGAARLDDPIKNLPLAVEALNICYRTSPGIAHAVFYGEVRNPEALVALEMPYVSLGVIPQKDVAQIYAHADVVLSTSRYETLPGTLVEGMAAGCTPVTTGNGGQSDIVDNGVTGYIASDDAEQLALFLKRALQAPFNRQDQHRAVAQRFADDAVARKYIQLLYNKNASSPRKHVQPLRK